MYLYIYIYKYTKPVQRSQSWRDSESTSFAQDLCNKDRRILSAVRYVEGSQICGYVEWVT